MKKLLKIALVFATLFNLSACTKVDNSTIGIGIIGGCMMNQAKYDYDDTNFQNCISDEMSGKTDVILMVPDGNPGLNSEKISYDEIISGSDKDDQLEGRFNELIDKMNSMKAKASENNIFKAIYEMANQLKDKDKAVLCICNSFLSTCAPANYVEAVANSSLAELDSDAVVASLKEKGYLVDLSNTDVYLFGIGQVSGNQYQLNPNDVTFLKEVAQKYFDACKAKSIHFGNMNMNSEDETELPTVSNVFVPDLGTDFYCKFDETSKVRFEYDSDAFIDEAAAKQALQVVKDDYDKTHESYVIAATSGTSYDYDYQKNLAKKRCNAIKNALIDLGIPENKLQVVSFVGSESPWYQEVDDGDAITDSSNRISVVLGSNTERAQKLIDGTYKDYPYLY